MRQIMPHRNNMSLHRTQMQDIFCRVERFAATCDVFCNTPSGALTCIDWQDMRYANQWFTCIPIVVGAPRPTLDMADMR